MAQGLLLPVEPGFIDSVKGLDLVSVMEEDGTKENSEAAATALVTVAAKIRFAGKDLVQAEQVFPILNQGGQGRQVSQGRIADCRSSHIPLCGQHREPDQQFGSGWFLADSLAAQFKKAVDCRIAYLLIQVGKVIDARLYRSPDQVWGQFDMVKDAAAKKWLGQTAFRVAGDDYQGRGALSTSSMRTTEGESVLYAFHKAPSVM